MASTKKRRTRRPAGQERELHALHAFETSFGWVAATWMRGRLDCLAFGYRTPKLAVTAVRSKAGEVDEVSELGDEARRFADRLRAYFEGRSDSFLDIPISLDCTTEFQRKVLGYCRQIPYGQTRSYAELARAAGSPNACRAVGNIMARNRIPLIIPCHRVVGSHGSLGGYSAPSGLSLKRQLLRLEGAECSLRT